MNSWRHFANSSNLQHPSTYGFGYDETHSDEKKVVRDVRMGLVSIGDGGHEGDKIALCKSIFLPMVSDKPDFLKSPDFNKYFTMLVVECMTFSALYKDNAIYNIFIDISDDSWFVNPITEASELTELRSYIAEFVPYILENLNELDYNSKTPENIELLKNIEKIIEDTRNLTRKDAYDRTTHREGKPITLLDFLIELLVHSYKNLRIYVYKPVGRFATPGGRNGLGQYIRFFTLFQQAFILGGVTIMPLRKMLFRDAHHSRETIRSSRFSRTFFEICERNDRRVFLLGTSTSYAHPSRHVNMKIPMRILHKNNQTTFGVWAGICSAYKPKDQGFPFLEDELLYQPFYKLEPDRRAPRIEFGETDDFTRTYWAYGLDEYVLGTYVRKRMCHPEIWGEVNVYFHQISCLASSFIDGDIMHDGLVTKFKLAASNLHETLETPLPLHLYTTGGISPYQDYLCLFASWASAQLRIRYSGMSEIDRDVYFKKLMDDVAPEDVRAQYHTDRLDRFDYVQFPLQPNDNILSLNVSMNKQNEDEIFNVLNCALNNPPPVQARGNQPFERNTAIIQCGGGRRKTISSSRRLLSLPKRKDRSSSSSSKKRYTRRRRALRSGKDGYRPRVTGRKV